MRTIFKYFKYSWVTVFIPVFSSDIRKWCNEKIDSVSSGKLNLSSSNVCYIIIVLLVMYLIWQVGKRVILLNMTGISFYERDTKTKCDKYVEEYFGDICDDELLYILCATGYHTFACIGNDRKQKAYLYDLISAHTGELHVLLLNPESDACRERAESLGVNYETYKKEIYMTIKFLSRRYKENDKIRLKLYCQRPVFKIIGCNNRLWVQNYETSKDVNESPLYGVKNNNDNHHDKMSKWILRKLHVRQYIHSLYPFFRALYMKKWKSDIGIALDLTMSHSKQVAYIKSKTNENKPLSLKNDMTDTDKKNSSNAASDNLKSTQGNIILIS